MSVLITQTILSGEAATKKFWSQNAKFCLLNQTKSRSCIYLTNIGNHWGDVDLKFTLCV